MTLSVGLSTIAAVAIATFALYVGYQIAKEKFAPRRGERGRFVKR
jgi:hypothetical protein